MESIPPFRLKAIDLSIRINLILALAVAEFCSNSLLRFAKFPAAFYYIAIFAAWLIFLVTMIFGKSAVMRDIQEICLYDVFVQMMGLISYEYKVPLVYYLTLAQAVWLLKAVRLLWGLHRSESHFHDSWPEFGVMGLVRRYWHRSTVEYTAVERAKIYGAIAATIPAGFVLLKIALASAYTTSAPISLILAALFVRPFRELNRAEAEQMAYLREKATLAAALAAQKRQLTEQNAELAALSAERAQRAREATERNQRLRFASHDLANRMMSAQSNIRRALALAVDEEQRRCLLELQGQQAQFLESLHGIIKQGQIDLPLLPPTMETVSSAALVANIWEAATDLAEKHGVVLVTNRNDFLLQTDAMQLERILFNLLSNAIGHNAPGTHVGLSLRRHPLGCQIRIWDNGSGIAGMDGRNWRDNFNRLAFISIANARKADAGHGVGLQSVAQLCAELGLTMTMYSRPRRGTVFRWIVPIAE